VFDRLADHSLPRLLAAGLRASVHSDDPAYFGGYVNDSLVESCTALRLTTSDAYTLLRHSLESSFLEPSEIAGHVARLDEVFGT
jgi:adenosine deaminase